MYALSVHIELSQHTIVVIEMYMLRLMYLYVVVNICTGSYFRASCSVYVFKNSQEQLSTVMCMYTVV